MIEINLIPDVKQELIRAQRARAAVVSFSILTSIIAGAVVVVLALYVFGGQTIRSSMADSSIDDKGKKLMAVDDLSQMLTLQNQLGTISNLNDVKKMDSRVFDALAAVIPPEPNQARISQLSIDAENSTITLEGQTRSFDSMEIFKKTIGAAVIEYMQDGEKQQVALASDISISDTSYGEDSDGNRTFRFVLSFTYPDELFSSSIDGVTFGLLVDGNVTDSYLGIPKTIFTEAAQDTGSEQ